MGKLLENAARQFLQSSSIFIYDKNLNQSAEEAFQADLVVLCVNDDNLEDCLSSITKHLNPESICVSISAIMTHSEQILSKFSKGQKFLITHPLFGPASYKNNSRSLNNFKIALNNYSLEASEYQQVTNFIEKSGLQVVHTTAQEHDQASARDHFLPYLISHLLKDLSVGQSPIRTYSAEQLVHFLECTSYSKTQLKSMYKYNPYVGEIIKSLDDCLKNTLTELTK